MHIHKEGTRAILIVFVLLILFNIVAQQFIESKILTLAGAVFLLAFFIFIVSFFRKPERNPVINEGEVLSPCDGKVVVIEETEEPEYFKGRRIQVSIFMSPLNVHINYYPINGEVKYVQYHPGRHLVAWHPKSSTENERSTIVIGEGKKEILVRQIAGTVARRIVTYSKIGEQAIAGDELGFIKFGSRVDLFFPIGSEIVVKLNQVVTGAETLVGRLHQ